MKKKQKMIKKRILKSSGNIEFFSRQKLHRSIQRTGLKPKYCREISETIAKKFEKEKPDHPTTKSIFKETIKLIKKQSTLAATHYSLKKSLQDLGPSGYEFEAFVGKYFETLGFSISLDVTLRGKYVTHEVDVIAHNKNDGSLIFCECKFHNNAGVKNDIKIALYVKARWDDLKEGPDAKNLSQFFLVSNTAFTSDAIKYANGVGLNLLGINSPDESFIDKIKRYKIYPITSLTKLKKNTIKQLLEKNILLCKELLNEELTLKSLGLTQNEIDDLFFDINKLIGE